MKQILQGTKYDSNCKKVTGYAGIFFFFFGHFEQGRMLFSHHENMPI